MNHSILKTTIPTFALCSLLFGTRAAEVVVTRCPEGGLQPQAIADVNGTVHLVYFKGDPKSGDLFYIRRPADSTEFTKPMRVNSKPGAAIAIGTIRGAQIALGRNSRIHVAWNGSGNASNHEGAPMLYTRLNDAGTAFEPERDVMTFTSGLDGGGSVAADARGNVYVAWHGSGAEKPGDEGDRAVFVAISTDEGKSFARERQANTERTGACGCCGMKAFADMNGSLYPLYRAARAGVERGAVLLASGDYGKTFRALHTHPWKIAMCPMSSAWLGPGSGSALAAWETMGRVWFTAIEPQYGEVAKPVAPMGGGQEKHPVVVANSKGESLLVWTEGTGWLKGGALAWQVFDQNRKPTETKGRQEGVPVWSFATAFARNNGGYEIIF